jgi:RimJ/RimL family protein N-acetyltransferase
MEDEIRIRGIGPAQRNLLIEMYDRVAPLGGALGLPPRWEEPRRDWIDGALSEELNLGAFSPGGAAVGHCFLVADKTSSGELAIFVHQQYRRRGVATALVKAMLKWGGVEGLRRVWTLTGPENTAALRLQEKLGFRPISIAPDGIELEVHLPAPCPAPEMHRPACMA